jgi:hypothetical protein
MKNAILAVLVLFGLSGVAMATHCNQQFVQRSVGYYSYPVVQQIVVPQKIIEYAEVPNLQVVERQYYVPRQQIQKQQQVVEKVLVQKVEKQRAQPVRDVLRNVVERVQDRQEVRQAVRQNQRQKQRVQKVVKEIRIQEVNAY